MSQLADTLKERFLLTGSGFDGTGYLTEESKLRKVRLDVHQSFSLTK